MSEYSVLKAVNPPGTGELRIYADGRIVAVFSNEQVCEVGFTVSEILAMDPSHRMVTPSQNCSVRRVIYPPVGGADCLVFQSPGTQSRLLMVTRQSLESLRD